MKVPRIPFPLALLCSLAIFQGFSRGAQTETYLPTDIGTLGGNSGQARAINHFGVVAGAAQDAAQQWRAVVLSNNVLSDLGTLGGSNSIAMDINNLSDVVGWAQGPESPAQKAFLFSQGVMTDLAVLLPGSTNSIAYGISDRGTVVGAFQTADGRERPFVYANGMIPLEFEGQARCITASGEIGGFELKGGVKFGFVISGVERRYVKSLNTGDTEVTHLTTNGIIVGRSRWTNGSYHGFAQQGEIIRDLGTLGGPTSEAFGANNAGHIVGWAEDKTNTVRAFLYRRGIMFDLNDFLPPESGWFLEVAYSINDSGQIVGEGKWKGQSRGFLLTPNYLSMGLYPGLVIIGKTGRSYRIDYLDTIHPTNSWQTLTNVTLLASPQFFLDPRPVQFVNRLYRSVLLPQSPP